MKPLTALALLALATPSLALPRSPTTLGGSKLEVVHRFYGHMPVGVAVNSHGRVFVSYPTWEDKVPFSLAEIKGGREVAYPNGDMNTHDPKRMDTTFVGVQGLMVDARDRLWVLDTGTHNLGPVLAQNAAKLVGIDTNTNKVIKTIHFPADVVLPNTYLNDLRIDLRQGKDGVAYITDSGAKSGSGLIVVDLESGQSWRKLTGDDTVKPTPGLVPYVDGQALFKRPKGGVATHMGFGADSIALSADGNTLYYAPTSSRRLYAVPTAALRDRNLNDAEVKKQVKDLGEKGVADGLAEDTLNRVYITNYEQSALTRRLPSGELETLVRDPRLIWPDTLAIQGGYLYVINNQLNRQGGYHFGKDLRVKPYTLMRMKIDAQPVMLK